TQTEWDFERHARAALIIDNQHFVRSGIWFRHVNHQGFGAPPPFDLGALVGGPPRPKSGLALPLGNGPPRPKSCLEPPIAMRVFPSLTLLRMSRVARPVLPLLGAFGVRPNWPLVIWPADRETALSGDSRLFTATSPSCRKISVLSSLTSTSKIVPRTAMTAVGVLTR